MNSIKLSFLNVHRFMKFKICTPILGREIEYFIKANGQRKTAVPLRIKKHTWTLVSACPARVNAPCSRAWTSPFSWRVVSVLLTASASQPCCNASSSTVTGFGYADSIRSSNFASVSSTTRPKAVSSADTVNQYNKYHFYHETGLHYLILFLMPVPVLCYYKAKM